jgi:hypothetical protein
MSVFWVPGLVHCAQSFDAAHCPDPAPTGYEGALVYAGGSSAAHAWTRQEIARAAAVVKWLLPTWVPTPGTDNPKAAGTEFVNWLNNHKVPDSTKAGHQVHLLWDLETGVEPDPPWVNAACKVTADAGWYNLIYGSVSWLFQQPERSGYWVAGFPAPGNPQPPYMYRHINVKATQYAANVKVKGGVIDKSLVSVELANQMWTA